MPETITAPPQAQATGQQPSRRTATQATPIRMRLAEVERQEWVCNCEFGTTIDDIQQPGYWAHMASKLKPYDHIEARVDDSTWLAHLLVLEAGRNWARVIVLNSWRLDSADISQTIAAEEHKVMWKGPQYKFSVIRVRDSALLSKEHRTREQADDWLRNYERTLNAAT